MECKLLGAIDVGAKSWKCKLLGAMPAGSARKEGARDSMQFINETPPKMDGKIIDCVIRSHHVSVVAQCDEEIS